MTQDKAEVFIKWLDSVQAENNFTDNQLAQKGQNLAFGIQQSAQ
jgi:hypothetical protein